MGKKTILQLITTLELGGAQKNVLNIVKGLDKNKFQVYLLSSDQGLLRRQAKQIKKIKIKFLSILKHQISPFWDLLTLFWLVFFMKRNKIQIVHTHSSKAGILGRWAAKISGVKTIVHTVHGWSFNEYQPQWKKIFYIWLEKISAKITTKVIFICQDNQSKGVQHKIVRPDQCRLIRYGIDQHVFHANLPGAKESIKPNFLNLRDFPAQSLIVSMVACLKPQKNPQDYVFIAEQILKTQQNTQFLLIGDGILREKIKILIKAKGIENNFYLLGWREDIPALLSITDVFVLTSLWEGLPIALLEAMACAIPAVAYAADGVKEVIRDSETGFLIKPNDVNSSVRHIRELLNSAQLRNRIGQKACAFIRNSPYDLRTMINSLESVYLNPADEAEKDL